MAWNLAAHILDHSAAVHNTLGSKRKFDENDIKHQHFTFSIDVFALLANHNCTSQKDIDEKMIAFMNDLINYERIYPVSKGRNKKGEKINRDIKFNFKNDILIAYHNDASDNINSNNYSVNPHFHILAHKSLRVGTGYKYFRDAIDEISEKHGLVFNYQEETGKEKIDSKKASVLTWFTKRSSDKDFIAKIESGWVEKALCDFQNHYKQTGNLQYLLKGYRDLELRCKRLGVSHDLDFSLFLSEEQKNTIKAIYDCDHEKIYEYLSDRTNHIARAFLEHCYGFSSIIIEEIEKRSGKKMPVFDINLERINVNIPKKEKGKKDYTKSINYCYKEDLKTALSYAKNEKDLAKIMKALGYDDFKFKAKDISGSRHRVGFSFINKDKKTTSTVYFNQLNTDMRSIRSVLKANNSKESMQIPHELHSHLKCYEPPKKSYSTILFEKIYELNASLDLKGFYVKELDSKAVEFKAKNTYIIDNGNRIEVKAQRQKDLDRNVILIADMFESKNIQRYNITGSTYFKIAMKAELDRRSEDRASKTQNLTAESLDSLAIYSTNKNSDEDILTELSDIHLGTKSIDNHKEEYMELYRIRSNAIGQKDIDKLLKTYQIVPTISHEEMRQKILAISKCLGISFSSITDDIGLDNGFSHEELGVFRDTIKQIENYDTMFLSKLIEELEFALNEKLILDVSLSSNQLERNIRLLETITKELDDFQAAHVSKKEYISRIEDIEQALASDSFYEVQSLMDGLNEDDRRVVEYKLNEKIDLASALLDFENLKKSVDQDMRDIQELEELLVVENDHKPTQELL